jgi:hypothetical protein
VRRGERAPTFLGQWGMNALFRLRGRGRPASFLASPAGNPEVARVPIAVMVTYLSSYLLRPYNQDAKNRLWKISKESYTTFTIRNRPIDRCVKGLTLPL